MDIPDVMAGGVLARRYINNIDMDAIDIKGCSLIAFPEAPRWIITFDNIKNDPGAAINQFDRAAFAVQIDIESAVDDNLAVSINICVAVGIVDVGASGPADE